MTASNNEFDSPCILMMVSIALETFSRSSTVSIMAMGMAMAMEMAMGWDGDDFTRHIIGDDILHFLGEYWFVRLT